MKIARIIARLNVGGPARQAILLTQRMNAAGHPSLLLAGQVPAREGNAEYLADQAGVAIHRIRGLSREISIFSDFLAGWEIYRLLRRERPDLVHTHTAKAGLLGRIAAFCARVPCVHTYHGHVFHGYFPPWKTRIFLLLERLLSRCSKKLIAISPLQLHELSQVYRVAPAQKFALVRLGFDLSSFLTIAAARDRALQNPSGLRIGWVGRLTAIKDPALFLHFAHAFLSQNPGARFQVIGDGDLGLELRDLARELRLGDALEFSGWLTDMPAVYSHLDMLVLTSKNEGTPVAVIEAMAAGCAVMAAGVGGVADLMSGRPMVHDGFCVYENGILVERRDAPAFCAAAAWLSARPQIRHAMGAHASRYIAAHYGQDRLVSDLLKLYASVTASSDSSAMPA